MAQGWRDGLTQWLRALTAHPEDLSLISEPISEVKYKNNFFKKVSWGHEYLVQPSKSQLCYSVWYTGGFSEHL